MQELLDLHTTRSGASSSALQGLQYGGRKEFVEVHHELVPRILSQSLLGSVATRRVRFPRPGTRKADKKARRNDPFYTIEEVSAHEAEQQRDHSARRSLRRITMGVTSSPFAPLSSSDDSDSGDGAEQSSDSTLDSTSTDSDSSDDSDTQPAAGTPPPGTASRIAGMAMRVEECRANANELDAQAQDLELDHTRGQIKVDALQRDLEKLKAEAAGPPSTPSRSSAQGKSRQAAYNRQIRDLERELLEAERACDGILSEIQRTQNLRNQGELMLKQLTRELDEMRRQGRPATPEERRARKRARRRERRRRRRRKRANSLYSIGLRASKLSAIVSDGISAHRWRKLSSEDAWTLYKIANKRLYAALMTYLNGHLPECSEYIQIGNGLALWNNIVDAHFFPDHALAAARKRAWNNTYQDEFGHEKVEAFVSRLRKEDRHYLSVCVRRADGTLPEKLSTNEGLLGKLRNDTAPRFQGQHDIIANREYEDGKPADFQKYLQGLNTWERRRIARGDVRFDPTIDEALPKPHDRSQRRRTGGTRRRGASRSATRSTAGAAAREPVRRNQARTDDPDSLCILHPNANHSNRECRAQSDKWRPRQTAAANLGHRESSPDQRHVHWDDEPEADAVRAGIDVPPAPQGGAKNVQPVRRLNHEEFGFCRDNNMCMRRGSLHHLAKECTATKAQVDSFYEEGLKNLMANKRWNWPGRNQGGTAGMARSSPVEELASSLADILSAPDEGGSAEAPERMFGRFANAIDTLFPEDDDDDARDQLKW